MNAFMKTKDEIMSVDLAGQELSVLPESLCAAGEHWQVNSAALFRFARQPLAPPAKEPAGAGTFGKARFTLE